MSPDDPWIRVSYPQADGGGVSTLVPPGTSVLAASLTAGISHASVCGGRGRCSACRVKVLAGAEDQAPPDHAELATLRPLLARDPSLRLACRLKPRSDIAVAPVMGSCGKHDRDPDLAGRMEVLTVMFIDLRGFSRMAARKHPFDVVFTLNRYFDLAATAVSEAGGKVDKFIGDGVMALFGVGETEGQGNIAALRAAKALSLSLRGLNEELAAELSEPLRIGIGLHSGPAILGRFGWGLDGQEAPETAIGDVVNIASRLEGLSKDFGCQLVISETVAQALGEDRLAYPLQEMALPNHDGMMALRSIENAGEIPLTKSS